MERHGLKVMYLCAEVTRGGVQWLRITWKRNLGLPVGMSVGGCLNSVN